MSSGTGALSDPVVGAIDRLNDLPPTCIGDVPAFIFQLRLGNGTEQIAFAECWPIQSVRFIKNDLMRFGRAIRSLGCAHEDSYLGFGRDASRMRDDDTGMLLRPIPEDGN